MDTGLNTEITETLDLFDACHLHFGAHGHEFITNELNPN